MLQMLVHPEEVRIMAGGDDPDQVRVVVRLRVIPISRGRPQGGAHLDHRADVFGARVLGGGRPFRPLNAGTLTGSSTSCAIGRPTSTAIRS